ncbi:hypothetical protein COCNU_01G014740 [Cocos nucifera]|uniref:Uncharacterized protein n=1 Tax=Cocos nucifera TaxID=13894 RepID=A0A8K0HVY9_COCNU|nr:hypothetical protein COCNU_01G014740 [Cocos nucifera]
MSESNSSLSTWSLDDRLKDADQESKVVGSLGRSEENEIPDYGPFKVVHHVDHFAEVIWEVWRVSKEAKEKATEATHKADDAQLSKLKAEEENRSLKEEVKRLESELAKAQADAEAQLLAEKNASKEKVEAAKVVGAKDFKGKVKKNFLDLNLDLLELDCEEIGEVRGKEIYMEDLFSPARED